MLPSPPPAGADTIFFGALDDDGHDGAIAKPLLLCTQILDGLGMQKQDAIWMRCASISSSDPNSTTNEGERFILHNNIITNCVFSVSRFSGSVLCGSVCVCVCGAAEREEFVTVRILQNWHGIYVIRTKFTQYTIDFQLLNLTRKIPPSASVIAAETRAHPPQ